MVSIGSGAPAIRIFAVCVALLFLAKPPQPGLVSGADRPSQPHLVAIRNRTNELVDGGKYAEAARLFESGFREATAVKDKAMAVHFLTGLGAARFALFEYRHAIDALGRARELARSAGNQRYLNAICANLCNIYMQAGDLGSARGVAEDCLHVPKGMAVHYRSQLLATLGVLARMSGDRAGAQQYLRSAVEEAELRADDRTRFEAWSHYAQALFEQGDLGAAEDAALTVFRLGRLPSVRELRPPYLLLARIHRGRGDIALASALVDRGVATPARPGDRQLWKMYFLYERALLRIIEGQRTAALSDLQLALSYARDWREAIAPSDSLRSGAEFWLNGVYDTYINLAAESNFAVQAFLAVEEERAASLLQILTDRARTPDPENGMPSSYWEDLARLRSLEIVRIANPQGPGGGMAQLRSRLSEAEARAGASFTRSNDEKNENLLSPDTLNILQRRIRPEEALFSFRLGNSASFVWAVTDQHLEMHQLVGADKLVALAERFRRSVSENAPDRDALGAELYGELFGPISGRVLMKRSWIVASDDAIFDIPFGALVVNPAKPQILPETKGRSAAVPPTSPVFLVEQHQTRRIPSAFFLNEPAGPPPAATFLGIGDGIYNTADDRWTMRRRAHGAAPFAALFGATPLKSSIELPRLVSSANELQSCAESWNARQASTFLTGHDLSREKLLAALRARPAVVHIAAHVLHPAGAPGEALIHLGLAPNGSAEVLTTRDIARLPASRALVVLSGCSSAAANSVRGSGVLGLTRSWLIAGARAVVGSRWPVPDDTGHLFRSFYAHMTSAEPQAPELSAALQHAQLEMLRSHTWRSDPRYWGAFYLLTKE